MLVSYLGIYTDKSFTVFKIVIPNEKGCLSPRPYQNNTTLIIMDMTSLIWVVAIFVISTASVSGDSLFNDKHQTYGAKHKKNDLWCYRCDTMDDGDKCSNLSSGNESKLVYKCPEHRDICMVKRYSYTTSTENSTSVLRMWSLERNCTHRCEPGCIVIGERTKLYACTACCERSLCNTGRGGGDVALVNGHLLTTLPALLYFLFYIRRVL